MSTDLPIAVDARYRLYTGTANQKVFAVPFPFLGADEVSVSKVALSGAVTLLTRPAGYAISGAGSPDGGSVTLKTGTVAGEQILIVGAASRVRASSVTRGGKFSSVATDEDFDRLTLIAQEHDRELARAPKVDYGATAPALAIGAAGTVPVWDAAGNLVEGPDSAALEAIDTALAVDAGRALVHGTGGSDPFDAGSRRIAGLADGVLSTDAATRGQLDTLSATIDALATAGVYDVDDEAGMLALDAVKGSLALRADTSSTFALSSDSPGTLADWKELLTPPDAVTSVAGLSGDVDAAALLVALGATDYATGTWTPVVTLGGVTTGIAYSTQLGRYVRLGKLVIATGNVALTSKGSGSGAALVTGLPFTSANDGMYGGVVVGYAAGMSSVTGALEMLVRPNDTRMNMYLSSNGGGGGVTSSHFTNDTQFYFTAIYTAA